MPISSDSDALLLQYKKSCNLRFWIEIEQKLGLSFCKLLDYPIYSFGVKKGAFYGHPEQKGEVTPPSLTISICENVALFPFRYDSVMLKTYFISLWEAEK